MKKLLFLAIVLICTSCVFIRYIDSIDLKNNSNQTIMAYGVWTFTDEDTTITFEEKDLYEVERSGYCILATAPVKDIFDQGHIKSRRFTVFIFHPDTLKKYSWEEVVNGYKIICRYDLDVPLDIEHLNKEIPYPPTKAMSGMKVYYPTVASDSTTADSTSQKIAL